MEIGVIKEVTSTDIHFVSRKIQWWPLKLGQREVPREQARITVYYYAPISCMPNGQSGNLQIQCSLQTFNKSLVSHLNISIIFPSLVYYCGLWYVVLYLGKPPCFTCSPSGTPSADISKNTKTLGNHGQTTSVVSLAAQLPHSVSSYPEKRDHMPWEPEQWEAMDEQQGQFNWLLSFHKVYLKTLKKTRVSRVPEVVNNVNNISDFIGYRASTW